MLDGELQLDAAIVPSVGEFKAPGSKVPPCEYSFSRTSMQAISATSWCSVLQKLKPMAPMTQGIAAPVNDLSRGCSAEDIVGVVAITAVRCQLNWER